MSTPVRHRTKLFRGQRTAEEVHQHLAFPVGARCAACPNRPLVRAIVMMELKEAMKNPAVAKVLEAAPEEIFKHIVQIKGADGKSTIPYFRCSIVYACKHCTPALEKQLAKAPSHCIVEFNRGPGTDKIVSS
jgi:hypothetical protein